MLAGFQGAEHFVVRKHGRHRCAAGQCLAEQRRFSLMLSRCSGEQFAGAAEPGLDLVEDQHHVMRGRVRTFVK